MRIDRPSSVRRAALVTAALLAVAAPRARAQQVYPQSLYWGAGLMTIPVAWVSPVSGDFAISLSGETFNGAEPSPQLAAVKGINTNAALSVSLWSRLELGWALYDDNPEWGFFANALALNEEDYRGKTGASHWVPSVAVGVMNAGPYTHVDRYTIGYELFPNPSGGGAVHEPDSLHQNFKTAYTVYAVVTKSFALSEIKDGWGKTNVSISLGYGNGLFSNDGGLGTTYSNQSTGGLFGGAKVDLKAGKDGILSFMLENNAWQWNLGGTYLWKGFHFGLYWMDLFPGKADSGAAAQLYNYSKFAFTVSWQSNVLGLVHGDYLSEEEKELQQQVATLQQEIAQRQQRIARLELEIQRYEAQNLLEIEQRRAAAEQALKQEKEALQALEERLQRLEQNAPQKPPR